MTYRAHSAAVDVLYADTDAMGIVYYANYLRFFEAGRLAYVRQFGPEIMAAYDAGDPVLLPVTSVQCRYHKPARVFDQLIVQTRLRDVKRASFGFAYRLLRGDELLAEGQTDHTCVNIQGRVRRFDARLHAFFERARQEE